MINTKKAQEICQEAGCEIVFCNYPIDKRHLNCIWYGGEIAHIKFNDGWFLTFGAYGDIKIYGAVKGAGFYVKDTCNSGSVYCELGSIIDDSSLASLEQNPNPYNFIEFENNNWFEVNAISPNGKFIDLSITDNVLEDNFFDSFDIEWFKQLIEIAKRYC